MKVSKLSLALLVAMMPLASNAADTAADISKAQSIESSSNKASSASQKRIDSSADSVLAMKAEIERLTEEVENLTLYRDHLSTLVRSQKNEAASIEGQIVDIKATRQGIVPLMYRMLDSLTVWVEQDKPIKAEQRHNRIERLQEMMGRADVSDAEKFRRILEAYQIELDYGTKLGTYEGQITADGKRLEANIFYLGRAALLARSIDGTRYWSWSDDAAAWLPVDPSQSENIDLAFAIAKKQATPALLTLPASLKTVLAAPEAAK